VLFPGSGKHTGKTKHKEKRTIRVDTADVIRKEEERKLHQKGEASGYTSRDILFLMLLSGITTERN